jgi:hypothetical protein
VQASFDEVLRLATKKLEYPLKDSKRATKLRRGDGLNSALLSGGIGRFFGYLARYVAQLFACSRFKAPKVHPCMRHTSNKDELHSSLKVNWSLRQSLAERDLIIKRMVHTMSLPELHTTLMGQWEDIQGQPVLIVEVSTLIKIALLQFSGASSSVPGLSMYHFFHATRRVGIHVA